MNAFYVIVALYSQGSPLATNIHLTGPFNALECVAEFNVIDSDPAYIVPGASRTVRCMDGAQVSRILAAEKSCTLIDGSPNDFDRDYACTGEVAK